MLRRSIKTVLKSLTVNKRLLFEVIHPSRDSIQTFQSREFPETVLGLPRSQAALISNTSEVIYTSGLYGINSAGNLVGPHIQEQTEQILENLSKILEDADSGLEYVVRTEIFLLNMKDYEIMNTVYKKFFMENLPTQNVSPCTAFPIDGAKITMSCVALPLRTINELKKLREFSFKDWDPKI